MAIDGKGGQTSCPIWSFTTIKNNPPQIEITYPKDNSTNIELSPIITWNATDNENDNIKYNIYLNDEIIKENCTLKIYQLSNLNPDTIYTIKIEAIDKYNAKTEVMIPFKTTKEPTISLKTPKNKSIVIGKTITLIWTANDPDNDKLFFYVYLDKNTEPITKIKSDITENNITVNVSDYDTYYWKVVAKEDKGATTESEIYSFKYIDLGVLKWNFKTNSFISYSSPAIDIDNVIYVVSWDNYLYAINHDGTLKWKIRTNSFISSPAIGNDGTIYIGSNDGYLYAIYTTSKGLADSPWPKFQHDNQNTGNYNHEK
ncbi:hypothetical protein X275_08630 [Marinitoga sp. 1197]|uniref:PQQ-binding-like beta-propeller repeat protein n=1 Tax=Marinitoga sp. 1197 TaxID=1428449 RepID=UPI0006413FC1|nr:PQQ-binding-like beta-propeller repeat protein [Marinitoga sp. 1197]KLO21594.1 hypothetical protein X275_08630 [Marinitoga sp. 1197]